jgi:hypothetical protein
MASASVSSPGGPGSWRPTAVSDDNRHRPRSPTRRVPCQSEEGRNVYIGIGTVLAIILIIVLLVWIF